MRPSLCMLAALPILLVSSGCQTNAPTPSVASNGRSTLLLSARDPKVPTSREVMRDHDAHGSAMRDAVARADLDTARREAKRLAELQFDGGSEPTWRASVNAMKAATARVAQAGDLAEASRGLAAVARACGDCHTALEVPSFIISIPPRRGMRVGARMHRHQWAAARLWDGLVAPSDDLWRAAASVLQDAPLEPERFTPDRGPMPGVRELAASVHALGDKASVAGARADREAIYAELMTTCATCHVRLGGGPAGN